MKISSPIGDYPYEIRGISLRRGSLIVKGSLGTWETTMEVEPRDWVELGRRLAPVLAVALAARRIWRFRNPAASGNKRSCQRKYFC